MINLYVNSHGGECCGRKHIYTIDSFLRLDNIFDKVFLDEFLNFINSLEVYDEEWNNDENYIKDLCYEITLTDYVSEKKIETKKENYEKYNGKTMNEFLYMFGFEKVYSFINPNTDNTVHVYLWSSSKV